MADSVSYGSRANPCPSQPASRRSSAPSASVVSAGAPGSRWSALEAQDSRGAVGLQVDAGDEPVAEQEGQHVVAVARFGAGT